MEIRRQLYPAVTMLLLKILIFTFVIVPRLADARPVDDESTTSPSEMTTIAAASEDRAASTPYTTPQPATDAAPSPEVSRSTVLDDGLSPSDATAADLPTTTAAGPETVAVAAAGTPGLLADVATPVSAPSSISSAADAAPPADPTTTSPTGDPTSPPPTVGVAAEDVPPAGPTTSPELLAYSSSATATPNPTAPAETLAGLIQTEIATTGPETSPTTVPTTTTTTGRTTAAAAAQVTSTTAHAAVLQAPGQSELIWCYEVLPFYYRCDTPQATYIVNLHM